MSADNALHLIVPDPMGLSGADTGSLSMDTLARLLSRGDRLSGCSESPLQALFSAFGLDDFTEIDLPAAALAASADGLSDHQACYLFITPVHLRADRDQLILFDSESFDLALEDAKRLAAEIQAVYQDDNWHITVVTPERWYLKVPSRPNIRTTPLAEVVGRHIDPCLPSGPDAGNWHRTLNEIQMILHASAVNVEREARGEPVVNSIWFWGAGTLPPVADDQLLTVWSSDIVSQGLAEQVEGRHFPLPATFSDWVQGDVGSGRHIVPLLPYNTAEQTGKQLQQALEDDWFQPLFEACRKEWIGAVTIDIVGLGRWLLSKRAMRRWWRRTRAIEQWKK